MPTKYTKPPLPEVTSVEELREALDKAFNVLVTQLNNSKVTSNVDTNNFRITNVARPNELHDAVNVEFLKDLLGKVALPRRSQASGGGSGVYEMHWGLGVGGPPVVSSYVAPPRIVAHNCIPVTAYIAAQTPPQGADFIVDIVKQDGTSIFGATKLVLPSTAAAREVFYYTAIFTDPRPTLTIGDSLSVHIDQVGSVAAGSKIAVLLDMGLT